MDKEKMNGRELTEKELEKVNGGLISTSELCASCQEYKPKDPNGIKGITNCQKYNAAVSMCRVMGDAGYKITV